MNRKRILGLALSAVLALGLLSGCGTKKEEASPAQTPSTAEATKTIEAAKTQVDVVTTASIVNEPDAFLKAISKDGTWIVAILGDMTFDKELVLDGQFKNGKKDADGKEIIQRKLALYTQNDKRVVTKRFTLTAPKLTVNSENARIQGGTFKGDVYVNAKGFNIVDAKVDGNIYFASEDIKASFVLDKTGSVSGTQEVKK